MPPKNQKVYEFGDFRLAPAERQLWQGEKPLLLTPKAFETLLILVERSGQLVTKDELMEIIWGDVIVEEIGLTRNISVLRKTLGDDNPKKPRYIETVSRFGYRFIADVREISREDGDQTVNQLIKIAVLPFQTIGLEETDKYLGIGIADAVITRLSNVRRLVVRPTAMILKYAAGERDTLAIGAELEVDYVLDGLMMRGEDSLRITVQGISLKSEAPSFGEKFEINQANLSRLQDLLSEQIAQQLLLNLTPEEHLALKPKHTPDAKAFEEYLKGRYFFNRKTPQNLWQAFEHFTAATQIDSRFALAYCGLADVYSHLQLRMALPSNSEQIVKAQGWLTKALELDPALAEAYATLGYFAYFYEWNWAKAEQNFLKALELNPNTVSTREFYANFLSRRGDFQAAHEQIQIALQLDSASFQTRWLEAQIFYRARDFERAWALSEKLIADSRDEAKLYHIYLLMGTSLSFRQQTAEAFAALERAESLSMRSVDGAKELLAAFTSAEARAGNFEQAHKHLRKLENLAAENDVAYELATVHANLGNFDEAFDLLFQLAEKRDWRLVHLKAELDFSLIQDDPRFDKLLQIVGLENSSSNQPEN